MSEERLRESLCDALLPMPLAPHTGRSAARRFFSLFTISLFLFSITWTGVRAATRRPPIEGLGMTSEQATIGLSKGKTKQPDFSQYIDLASISKHKLRARGGRVVFVGDIHGMDKSLKKLLKKLKFDANHDTLIHTGDIILKGPKSQEVIQEVIRLNALGVRGNQDQKVVEWRGWINWVLSQDGGKQWLKKMEKRAEALDKPTKADYKRFKKAAAAKGWTIPDGWKFGDEIYLLARHLSSKEYQYLLSMPIALHIPSLHTIVVHAGLLPMDPRRKVISSRQPLSHPPTSKNHTEETLRSLQELALLTDIPQNTDPWAKMNMRSVLNNGKVSRDNDGIPWSDLWHKVIKLCDGFDVQPTSNSTTADFASEDGWADWIETELKGVKSLPCKDVTVIYGHTASKGLDIKKWSKGLDTGCVYNLRLTALVVGKPWKASSSSVNATEVDEDMYQVDEELDGEVVSFGKKGRGKIVQVRCAEGEDRLH
ncbi:calcineurin-like phosphoesterase superfamily protein [Rhizoctonia solani 123E]|uniref:Calcineurin-like phosphoesterase superfamily protein n=1 Tax=Rhizoctonia solani 123E TaxID=1423351 RepID=A0A074RVP9_9AGAM|nr:calcineurin-like phosphoesterase superfamily protein [Rhizoctonia solani 123E]